MTKFNPQNKETLTYGEALDPTMNITEQEDADQYKRDYIAFIEKVLKNEVNENGQTAEEIANANIGYFAGYGSDETRERVERLFKCSHPIFGSIKTNGSPSAEKAFTLGKIAGQISKNN